MSDEGPKLFNSKPKKSKLKASKPVATASSSSKGAAAAAPSPPTPPPLPQDSFATRYKFFGKLVLGFSFITGVGTIAYFLFRTLTTDKETSDKDIPNHPTGSTSTSKAPSPAAASVITEKPVTPPISESIQRAPIPEDQQRELLKWMLEEKRKLKPKDVEEKKRIDEEKAILKQFIKAKSLPSI